MSFDNRVFDVNGETQEELRLAFRLAFAQEGRNTKAKYWTFDTTNGLILHWYISDANKANVLPVPLDAEASADLAWQWLKYSDEAKTVKLEGWFMDEDHDGSNSLGWRAYVGRWGHVGDYSGTIIAVTPSYLWHGK